MPVSVRNINLPQGLTQNQVADLQKEFGKNLFHFRKQYRLLRILWSVSREPMFILLLVACLLYFILGETAEGIMMLGAMVIIAGISFYQEVKSTNALNALKELSEPKVRVLRDGAELIIGYSKVRRWVKWPDPGLFKHLLLRAHLELQTRI